MNRFRAVGRIMNGTEVAFYRVIDNANGERAINISREQMIFFAARGEVEGVTARLYRDKVNIQAKEGYINLSDLPQVNIKSTIVPNVAVEKNSRKKQSKLNNKVVAKLPDGHFVCDCRGTGGGMVIMNRRQLEDAVSRNMIINAWIEYLHDESGRKKRALRLKGIDVATGKEITGIKSLPVRDFNYVKFFCVKNNLPLDIKSDEMM